MFIKNNIFWYKNYHFILKSKNIFFAFHLYVQKKVALSPR